MRIRRLGEGVPSVSRGGPSMAAEVKPVNRMAPDVGIAPGLMSAVMVGHGGGSVRPPFGSVRHLQMGFNEA